jgi:TonB family protein
MFGRFICAVGCLLASGVACSAQQTVAPAAPTQQASALPEPINSPEIDALAAKIIDKLRADKVASVVVVGGGIAGNKVNELGVILRNGLNDALARQAAGVSVIPGDEARAELRRMRVSEGMLYSNALGDWIAARTHADGVVTVELERVESDHATVSVQLFDRRVKKVYDKKKKTEISAATFESQINLTETQARSATRIYQPPLNTPVVKTDPDGKNGIKLAGCDYCPKPEYSSEARQKRIQGTVYLLVTVLPDGTADDVLIIRPVGYGLDAAAIEKLLTWKFKPALDAQKRPVATQVPVEIMFALYSGPF